MKNNLSALLLAFVLNSYGCSKKADPPPAPVPPVQDTTTLKGVSPFFVGAAIYVSLLQNNTLYRNILLQQESSITTENTLKWPSVHPSENVFDFSGGDYIASFCSSNHKRMHGHCLVWYQSNPAWLNNFSGDSLAWENLFKTHIQTVVSHYKGEATSWDVVNEAFHDEDGSLRVNDKNTSDNFDDGCIWARHLGRDYIARAFIYAHQADSSALLFYNDYGQEWSDKKTDSIIAMVNDFKARHISINGLGIQMHTNINQSKDGIINAFKKLAATGLLIHISELDISVNTSNDPLLVFTGALAQQQANTYAFIATQYKLLVPPAQQYGITTWNVTDKDSWIRTYLNHNDWPLLFNDSYARKPAFYSYRTALMQ
ncbi:MAG: endo-1,4-beta-xylanase [Sphingobacteriales bacterium]|nr:endo-1,4-beta-xylanase [Sphingobacteriales bacterium]